MTTDESYEKGLRLRRETFGAAGTDELLQNVSEMNEKMQDIVTRYCFGDIWQRDGLDLRTRSMITLSMLVALGREHETRIHLKGAIANGVTAAEIRELMVHSFLYCGIPAAATGLRIAEEVLADAAGSEASRG